MADDSRLPHGSPAWFAIVGEQLLAAARQADRLPEHDVSLVERYTDGVEWRPGLFQGLRFDIVGGQPSFRLGAGRDERGDITVEVTAAASYTLNSLRGADPRFDAAAADLQASGEFRVDGELSQLGSWFSAVHDRIVDRTA